MRVLGIDPSLQSTGYGLIDAEGTEIRIVDYGLIRPPVKEPFHNRINRIRIRLEELIDAHEPLEVSVENPFYARNIRTALTLGQVRGAVLVAVASRNCALFEYSALEIKKAVTGYGQADKHQVQTMVRTLLGIGEALPEDASDALAAAVCHSNARLFLSRIGG